MLYDFRNSFIWNKIAPLVPDKITSAASKLTVENTKKSAKEDEEVWHYLQPLFAEKVKKLEKLLNKKFDEWEL